MNHNAWLWKKRSQEKTIHAADKANISSRKTEGKVSFSQPATLATEKDAGVRRSVKSLNEKLASVILGCQPSDESSLKHSKMPPDQDNKGENKAEPVVEVKFPKKKVEEDAGDLYAPASERSTDSDSVLDEHLAPLRSIKEKERSKHDIINMCKEHERVKKELEEELQETNKRLAEVTVENAHLSKALQAKEKSIEDLQKIKSKEDAEFRALMSRLDSIEKENAFLKYEYHMLEKELEIRKEETEYSRQYADTSHKQCMESVQKITELEAECQRLHLLLCKRPPGHAALMHTKSEVRMMRRETENRKKKPNPTRDLICKKSPQENSPEVAKRISSMAKQLQELDEENKTLRIIISKRDNELNSSRITYAQVASRLSQAEDQLLKLAKVQKPMGIVRQSPISNEISFSSYFDVGSDDGVSSSGSWATALISELENFKNEKLKDQQECKAIAFPDMRMLDDYVQVEKLPIVSAYAPETRCNPDSTTHKLVLVDQDHTGFSEIRQESQLKHVMSEKSFDWIQIVLNAVLQEKCLSKRSVDELFEDIKIALGYVNHPTACKADMTQISQHLRECDSSNVSGSVPCRFSNLIQSIKRIIKLIQGITVLHVGNNFPDNCLEMDQNSHLSHSTPREYFIHVFQWKVSELNLVLQQFLHTCNDILVGKTDLEKFVEEVAFVLDWTMNNNATTKGASATRDKIKKRLSWDEPQSEIENRSAIDGPPMELDIVQVSDKESLCSQSVASSQDLNIFSLTTNVPRSLHEENKQLKDEIRNMESEKRETEEKLLLVTVKTEDLTMQLQQAEKSIESFQVELEKIKESKRVIEGQMENQKLINEDLDTQLTITQAKLNEFFQKFSSLEVELETKNTCCEELEATCLELQLQLESIAKRESPECGMHEVEKQSQTAWEITAASVKLAECQETILNLGKQLKALASSSGTGLLERGSSNKKNFSRHTSLHYQMKSEDTDKEEVLKSTQNKITAIIPADKQEQPHLSDGRSALLDPDATVGTLKKNLSQRQNGENNIGSWAIVPSKKPGGFGLLRKLLFRRKRSSKRKECLAKRMTENGHA